MKIISNKEYEKYQNAIRQCENLSRIEFSNSISIVGLEKIMDKAKDFIYKEIYKLEYGLKFKQSPKATKYEIMKLQKDTLNKIVDILRGEDNERKNI